MSSQRTANGTVAVHVSNIGGIDESDVDLDPGVNVLSGRNATNRTSFLRSVMAALGSDQVAIKGDADEGSVELAFGDAEYTRTLRRRNGTVTTTGDPYLDDATVADLFAFLLESNEARQAVARGDDLREIIMRPVDTEAIKEEIQELEAEKRRLDDDIDEVEALEDRIPELEAERQALTDEIADLREELAAKEAEIEAADVSADESREGKAELDDRLDDLQEKRSDLEDVRFRLETARESLEALREEREELTEAAEELPETPAGDVSEIDARLDSLRERKRSIDATITQLQSIIQFNEEMLDGENGEILDALDADDDGAVTDRLLSDDGSAVCWTCGSEVETSQIQSTIDQLRSLRQEKLSERNGVGDDIDDLQRQRKELEEQQRRADEVDRKLRRVESEIDDRESQVDELTSRREELADDIEDLEETVERLEDETYSDLLDLHREANQLEFELGRLERDRDDIEEEMADVESRIEERDRLEARRDEVREDLQDLRTRIDRIEADAVDAFNEHMQNVLDTLDYDNLERIWIERGQRQVREGRRTVTKTVFDLHVIRTTDDGTAYEDTVDHLSESEREVTGLVFALAGYLVHDVHETVPFMLLDSLEAIDSDRIAALVDYFEEYVPYVVVALLPEDAQALDERYHRVREI
ncbi:archaea-specific SMC-related protein [Halobacteriaceae archaeon GCM10025711]